MDVVFISAEPSVLAQGNETILTCRSDKPWQWCYWLHEDTNIKFKTFQVSPILHACNVI